MNEQQVAAMATATGAKSPQAPADDAPTRRITRRRGRITDRVEALEDEVQRQRATIIRLVKVINDELGFDVAGLDAPRVDR